MKGGNIVYINIYIDISQGLPKRIFYGVLNIYCVRYFSETWVWCEFPFSIEGIQKFAIITRPIPSLRVLRSRQCDYELEFTQWLSDGSGEGLVWKKHQTSAIGCFSRYWNGRSSSPCLHQWVCILFSFADRDSSFIGVYTHTHTLHLHTTHLRHTLTAWPQG